MEAASMGKKKAKRNYRRTVLRSTVAQWQFLAVVSKLKCPVFLAGDMSGLS